MSDQPGVSTQEPLYKAAAQIGTVIATLLGVVGGAVQLGIVSSEEATALNELGTQVTTALPELAGAVTLIVGVVSGIGASVLTAWQARKKVVPVDSDALVIRARPPQDPGEHRLPE